METAVREASEGPWTVQQAVTRGKAGLFVGLVEQADVLGVETLGPEQG